MIHCRQQRVSNLISRRDQQDIWDLTLIQSNKQGETAPKKSLSALLIIEQLLKRGHLTKRLGCCAYCRKSRKYNPFRIPSLQCKPTNQRSISLLLA